MRKTGPKPATIKRFQRIFSIKTTVDENGCVLWTGSRNTKGYGTYSGWMAHRLSYAVHKGPIPDGLHICHSCDNPPCVNPSHLRADNAFGNMRDAVERGRLTPNKPRTPEALALKAIAMIAEEKTPLKVIAESLGLSESVVRHIHGGRTWQAISGFDKSRPKSVWINPQTTY